MHIGSSCSNCAICEYSPARASWSSVLAACLASAVASESHEYGSARKPPQMVVKLRNTAGSCRPPQRAKRMSLDSPCWHWNCGVLTHQLLLNVANSSDLGWTFTPICCSCPITARASFGLSDEDRSIVAVKPLG